MNIHNNLGNPFARVAYSPIRGTNLDNEVERVWASSEGRPTFTGANIRAFVGARPIGNLQSITYSSSRETVGDYVMGREDAVSFPQGKRVIVGSMVLTEYDRHALLMEALGLPADLTLGDMWRNNEDWRGPSTRNQGNVGYLLSQRSAPITTSNQTINAQSSMTTRVTGNDLGFISNPGVRGLSTAEYEVMVQEFLRQTATLVGRKKVAYSDMVPAFDMTLVGVTDGGQAARMAIYGIKITQESGGKSMNDLGNAVGVSFVCKYISAWRPILADTKNSLVGELS